MTLGKPSLIISSLFPAKSVERVDIPVTLPPGLARLSTSPFPTGSPTAAKTMGMIRVACLAALVLDVLPVTMTSTLSVASSLASSSSRSGWPSANRYSIWIFCPSI